MLRKADFANDQEAIHWVLGFMKEGRAATFADRVIRHEERKNTARFVDWKAFREEFVRTFCPKNEATLAIMKLESEGYFQGK